MRQKRQIAIVELYEAMFLPENVIRGIHPKGGQLANSQIWLGSSHVFTNFFTVDIFYDDQNCQKRQFAFAITFTLLSYNGNFFNLQNITVRANRGLIRGS